MKIENNFIHSSRISASQTNILPIRPGIVNPSILPIKVSPEKPDPRVVTMPGIVAYRGATIFPLY